MRTDGQGLENSQLVSRYLCGSRLPLPEVIQIEATSRCNLKCVMCRRQVLGGPSGGGSDLRLTDLDRLASILPRIPDVALFGVGEPLLHPQLPELVERCKAYGCRVHIATNGTLLTLGLAERLINSGLDYLHIAFDSATVEGYHAVRRSEHFPRLVEAVKCVNHLKAEHGCDHPRVGLTYALMSSNIAQLPDFIKLASDLGIDVVTLNPLVDFGTPSKLHLSEDRVLAGRMYWDSKALAKSLAVRLVEPGWQMIEKEIQGIPRDPWPAEPEMMASKPCLVPWVHSYVTALGDVVPCCNTLPRHVMGNIRDRTFEDIWHGERYQAFRAQMLSSNPPEGCRDCGLPEPPWSLQTPAPQTIDMGKDNILGASWQGLEGRALGWHEREWQRAPTWRGLVRHDSNHREIGSRIGFRWTGSRSVLFLKNVGPGLLRLDVGTLSLVPAAGSVMVNGKVLGRFRVPPGRTELRYRLGEHSGAVLAVEIVVEGAHCVARLNRLWRLINAAWTSMSDMAVPMAGDGRRTFRLAYQGLSRDSRIVGVKVYRASTELAAVS